MAKKRGKAKWVILSFILLIILISAGLILYFNKVPNKNERFVDTIQKINPLGDNRDAIQNSLDSLSYAQIIITIDSPESVEKVLSSLSPKEFQLQHITITTNPQLVSGNATKSAISKLGKNIHVIKIGYNYPVSVTAQESYNKSEPFYIGANLRLCNYSGNDFSEIFPSDLVFESEKNAILSALPKSEYKDYSEANQTYDPRSLYYDPSGNATRTGFKIKVTPKGRDILQTLKGELANYICNTYYSIIIDNETHQFLDKNVSYKLGRVGNCPDGTRLMMILNYSYLTGENLSIEDNNVTTYILFERMGAIEYELYKIENEIYIIPKIPKSPDTSADSKTPLVGSVDGTDCDYVRLEINLPKGNYSIFSEDTVNLYGLKKLREFEVK